MKNQRKSPSYAGIYSVLEKAEADDHVRAAEDILENYFIKQEHLDKLLNSAIMNEGDGTILEILLNVGADPTANGSEALLNAIEGGDDEIVEMILNTHYQFPPDIMLQVEKFRQNHNLDCNDEDGTEDDEDELDILLSDILMC